MFFFEDELISLSFLPGEAKVFDLDFYIEVAYGMYFDFDELVGFVEYKSCGGALCPYGILPS